MPNTVRIGDKYYIQEFISKKKLAEILGYEWINVGRYGVFVAKKINKKRK